MIGTGKPYKTLNETLEYIETIVPLPAARRKKYTYMYETAKLVEKGCIVELGTHYAPGSIALAYGALAGHGAHVYTVDFWTDNLGWGPVMYYSKDQVIARKNISDAGLEDEITMIDGNIFDVVRTWDKEIGFLFWDLALSARETFDGMSEWALRVIHDGYIIVRDLPDGSMGAGMLAKNKHSMSFIANDQGFWCYRRT